MKASLNYFLPDDGVRLKASIRSKRNLHDGLTFTYRPVDQIERKSLSYQLTILQNEEKYDEAARRELEETLKRIDSWDIPITPDQFITGKAKMNPELFQDIYRIVWGFAGADELEVIAKNS